MRGNGTINAATPKFESGRLRMHRKEFLLKGVSITLTVFLSFILIVYNGQAGIEGNKIEIPVFSGAYDVNKGINSSTETTHLSFKVKASFPASEVISFYDDYFASKGLEQFSGDNYGDRKWNSYIYSSRQGEPKIDQWIGTWIDKSKKVRIVLSFRYMRSKDESRHDELEVFCQVRPFFLMPGH